MKVQYAVSLEWVTLYEDDGRAKAVLEAAYFQNWWGILALTGQRDWAGRLA